MSRQGEGMTISVTTAATPRVEPAGGAGGARRRFDWRGIPAWAQALFLYAVSRALFTFVAYRAADLARPHPDGRHRRYLEIANNWDGTWYRRIAVEGYPSVLPVDSMGAAAPNTWAFYPLFPRTVSVVMRVTGLDWTLAATVVSLVAGAAAVVVVRSVLARVAGPRTAMWSVAFLCFFPAAPVLQLPYSESLALLLLALTFWCLQCGRYLLAVPVILALGLARPVAVPMAAVLGVHLLREVWAVRRLPRAAWRSLAGPAAACAAGVAAAAEWPLLAWRGTGVPNAYTLTMAAWRTPHQVVPVRPWAQFSQHLLGAVIGPVVLVAALAALAVWLARRGWRVLGADLVAWCGFYLAYLVAVLDSFTSLPRYLLPLFPLGALLASTSSSRAFRVAVTVSSAVGGVGWMLIIWRSRIWAP
jgi:hypothetical protein